MIGTQQLRKLLDTGPGPILVDAAGSALPMGGLAEDASPPALLVTAVTEAVKEVDGGTVVRYLNRDAMWAVQGFLLSHEIVSDLPDGIDSAAALIEAVGRAGLRWSAILPSPPAPLE